MATSVPITSLPLPFKPHIPVTPPPDCQHFPPDHSPLSPQRLKGSTKDSFGGVGTISMDTKIETQATATTTATSVQQQQHQCQGHDHDLGNADPTLTSLDPRYLAMVSRIASYYQQRCQAVANYQHQRCQAWANMQRQKCQEMTQAAMLVVAWYVRDRIQRRRKRQKRQFRRGLSERTGAGVTKTKKGESVRKWVSKIPEGALSPNINTLSKPMDMEELEFSIDNDPPPDKDAKLYSVADNLIKGQLASIDMPLMGAISFDESDSESESEDEELNRWRRDDDQPKERGEDEAGLAQMDDYDDDDDDDEEYSYEDEDMEDYDDDDASALVHKGTGTPKDSTSLDS